MREEEAHLLKRVKNVSNQYHALQDKIKKLLEKNKYKMEETVKIGGSVLSVRNADLEDVASVERKQSQPKSSLAQIV